MGFMDFLFGTSVDFKELVEQGALILDVRTPAEYHAGNIKGSMNISVEQVPATVNDFLKMNKTIITVCRSGARSGMAAGYLKSAGIDVHNGGAWNSLQKKIA
jgi:phage shock protein E